MFVCHCRAVTDHELRDAIAAGARTMEDLGTKFGAGVRCGGCWPALYELLDEATDPSERPAFAGDPT
jgi:bacterioferritin-associated ferredoxin